jgi:pimeloyl-ACP methyl ester carboxylesterase
MTPEFDTYEGGSGTPLVLLHGINGSWRIWKPVLPELTQRHRVIAPTLAGHLGGPQLGPGRGIAPLADAIETLLDDYGLEKAHFAGNSLGAWLSCELAQRGRALSVVAFSPPGSWARPGDLRRLGRLMKMARSSSHWSLTARLVESTAARRALLRPAMERGDRIPVEVAKQMLAEVRGCVLLDPLLEAITADGPVKHFDIDCPVRIAWPYGDRTIPFLYYGQPFLAAIADSELVALRGVGHVPMYDDPELVARTVLNFTARADQ